MITLKYPDSIFTQTELAAFNGVEKALVYLPMMEAIKGGILIKTGTRPQSSGRGKPSNLYRAVNSSDEVPLINNKIIAPVTVSEVLVPVPTVTPPSSSFIAPVVNPEPIIQNVIERLPNPAYLCPMCNQPMTVIQDVDGRGVMVWCNSPCDPKCHENPFGHGKNEKDAYAVAREKFGKTV